MSLVNQRFMFGRDGSLTPIDPAEVARDCGVGGESAFDTPRPPRHSADDYRAIAERLKDLGYRGWITG